jgi:hypothetical protein
MENLSASEMMDLDELAVMLGLKRESVRWYLCQKPERLPPRVAWLRKPMFSRAVVTAWLAARDGMAELKARLAPPSGPVSAPAEVRRGRPRRAATT